MRMIRITRNKLVLALLVCTLLVLYFNLSIVQSIFVEWNSNGAYSHGLLGLLVVAYSAWWQRDLLAQVSLRPTWLGIVALLLSAVLLLVSELASIQQLQQVSLLLVMVAVIWALAGIRIIQILALPLLMLALILPVWSLLQGPLRYVSTLVSYSVANLFIADLQLNGYHLITSGGIFSVEPSCSGLGFFLVAALLAVCVSFFNHLQFSKGCLLFTIALLFAIVANWIRIIVIVVVGERTQMQHTIVQDHLTFGWFVFAACLIPLIFIIHRYFNEVHDDALIKKSMDDTQIQQQFAGYANNLHPKSTVLATATIILVVSLLAKWLPTRYQIDYRFSLPAPEQYQLVSADNPVSPNWQPISHGASSESYSHFSQGNVNFQVYLANYARQSQGHEMIYLDNKLFNKQRWRQRSFAQLPLAEISPLGQVNLLSLVRSNNRARSIAYWYVVNGQYSANKKVAKLLELRATLIGQPGATLIAVAVDHDSDEQATAIAALSKFTTALTATVVPKMDH